MGFQNIVVGYDSSPYAKAALLRAVELAQAFGGAVTLVHAFDAERFSAADYRLTLREKQGEAMQNALEDLQAAGRTVANLKVDTILDTGHPAEVLVKAAETKGADLIVVGSRGLRALGRIMLGSTSDRVLHLAKVPVLVVHLPGDGG